MKRPTVLLPRRSETPSSCSGNFLAATRTAGEGVLLREQEGRLRRIDGSAFRPIRRSVQIRLFSDFRWLEGRLLHNSVGVEFCAGVENRAASLTGF